MAYGGVNRCLSSTHRVWRLKLSWFKSSRPICSFSVYPGFKELLGQVIHVLMKYMGLMACLGINRCLSKHPRSLKTQAIVVEKLLAYLFLLSLSSSQRISRPTDSCFNVIHRLDGMRGNQHVYVKAPTEVEDSIYRDLKVVGIFVPFRFIMDSKNI